MSIGFSQIVLIIIVGILLFGDVKKISMNIKTFFKRFLKTVNNKKK
jgi:Sec-independent protein translocase protein TatA